VTRAMTTNRATATHALLRTESGWRHSICLVTTLCDHNPPRLGIMVALLDEDGKESAQPSRAKDLEQRMWRIAAEVFAADLMPASADAPARDLSAQIAELTSQQWEITMRLINGERVPTIARAMHLSQSTIRNHLTAVFRRFEVHSQAELLGKLRGSSS
jgi:DNA-binding CsgD family transcriptional regulator